MARDKSALFDNGKNLQITQKKFVLVILMLCCWCFVTIILWCFDVSFFLLILLIEIQPISLPPGKKSIFHQMFQPTGYLFRFRENLLTIWRAVGSPMSRHWHQIQRGNSRKSVEFRSFFPGFEADQPLFSPPWQDLSLHDWPWHFWVSFGGGLQGWIGATAFQCSPNRWKVKCSSCQESLFFMRVVSFDNDNP